MEQLIEELYVRLYRSLFHSAMSVTRNPSITEDIVSAAFARMLERKEKIQSPEHLKRSLHVIVRNESINYLRFKVRQQRFMDAAIYSGEYYEIARPMEKMLESDHEKQQLQALLQDGLQQLPRQRKKVIEYYFKNNQGTIEIAHQLNLSGQTVLNHKAKALEALRRNSAKLRPLYRLCK